MKTKDKKRDQAQRFIIIDFLRGLGVLFMIVFHGVFDLNFSQLVEISFLDNLYWNIFGRFTLVLFLSCSGMALAIVHKDKIRWYLVRKRFFKIGGWALAITVVTFIMFPRNYIFFGVLHCIAFACVVGVFFVDKPKLSLFLFPVLVIPDLIFQPTLIPMEAWLGVAPIDYVPLYPWGGFVLLGIYLESINFHRIALKKNVLVKPFEVMGKHSLKIYLLHQPVLYFLFLSLVRLRAAF